MVTIGIICAMDSEFDLIKQTCSHGKTETSGRFTFYVAEYGGKRVVASLCGVGKVNAAACTQAIISGYRPDYFLNSGVAGALSGRLHILDIVVADELVYHDLEERLLENYFPRCGRFKADKRLQALVQEICAGQQIPCITGRITSGDQFVTDSAVKDRIFSATSADAIEMEGCAVGHVCYLNEVPFAIVRCISDGADDQGDMDYDTFVGHAAKRCAKLTLALIERI